MVNSRNFFILLFIIILGCNENTSNVVPLAIIKHLERYHCWPYDVNVYSVDEIEIDSLFYTYPLKIYFCDTLKYEITTWTEYSKIDTTVWYGMGKTLEQCDNNLELYNQILMGSDIYYAGSYQYFKNQQGEQRRRYEKILFLNLSNKRMQIFKDINKVY